MEPEVVEIPPPSHGAALSSKQKEVASPEVINLDDDEDNDGILLLGGTIGQLNKGKAIVDYSNGYSHLEDGLKGSAFGYCVDDVEIIEDMEPLQKKGAYAPLKVDLTTNDLCSYDEEITELECMDFDFMKSGEDMDIFSEKYLDDYDKLQSHFDSMDIPTGVEAPVPWWADISRNNSWISAGSVAASSSHKTSTLQSSSTNPAPSLKTFDLTSSSGSQGQPGSWTHPLDVDLPIPLSLTPTGQGKKSRPPPPTKSVNKSFSFGLESFKARRLLEPFRTKKMNVGSSSSGKLGHIKSSDGIKMPTGVDPLMIEGGTLDTGYVSHHPLGIAYKNALFSKTSSFTPFPATGAMSGGWWQGPSKDSFSQQSVPHGIYHGYVEPFGSFVHVIPKEEDEKYSSEGLPSEEEIIHKFQLFRQFDIVQGVSDHHFDSRGTAANNQSNKWLKRIQEEWKILEKDLPDSIFVRAYDTRMDLLRAVMVGAEGTPYHDGLFFFDIYFPPDYPNIPPLVHYHSGGLRINPNLYGCGKVCLSLLNTWGGQNKNERWMPGTSTMLQVLVSIQGLILNEKPYFNEPGFSRQMGTVNGEKTSLKYNEDIFILSLRTMLFTMRKPPEHFKDFVVGHFSKRAPDIIGACRAYIGGALVGSLVPGAGNGPKADDGDQSSPQFRNTVSSCIGLLLKAFTGIGVKGCEKYSPNPAVMAPVSE
ncbi:hypothetical protein MLD38_034187 [Melastoma candidum]|uniref:Uncharacterized protein n=1 Tax=Melastoma candidum TaxID=119954 RepID=A0ACB9M955_9MYRT|nr:hypothetical protein MLD38_034187 [Melastoma candidum]